MNGSKIIRVFVILAFVFFIAGNIPAQAKTLKILGSGLVLGSVAYAAYIHERPGTKDFWDSNKIIAPGVAFVTGFSILLLSKEDNNSNFVPAEKLFVGPVIRPKSKTYGLSLQMVF